MSDPASELPLQPDPPRRGKPIPRYERRRGILSEETVHREGQPDVENPYWEAEEPQEHPNPELGCIRRGLCCKSSPGAFGPGELEQAAALLDLEPDAFVRRYAVVVELPTPEGVEREGPIHAFAPVKLDRRGKPLERPGTLTDRLYHQLRGPCIFYEGDGCRIYGARPIECRRYVCTQPDDANLSHEELARLWLAAEAEDGGE